MGRWGTGKVQKDCLCCGVQFFARIDRPGMFCSKSCASRSRVLKNFHFEYQCKICGKSKSAKRYRRQTAKYCSKKCLSIGRGIQMRGKNHPKWRGGASKRSYLSRFILEQRKREVKKCEKCGSEDNLEGHHRKGYSNDLFDIEILCCECHAKEHPRYRNFIRKKYGRKVDTENAHEKGCIEKNIACEKGREDSCQ